MVAMIVNRSQLHTPGHNGQDIPEDHGLARSPEGREPTALDRHCRDCRASQYTDGKPKTLQQRRSPLSDLFRRRSGKSRSSQPSGLAICHDCGEQFHAEDDQRKRDADRYDQLRQMIRDELSFKNDRSPPEPDFCGKDCSDASSSSEASFENETPLDLTTFAPFSLVDDERWGTGMSATLPFLQHAGISTPKELSSPQCSQSSETLPPSQHARHDRSDIRGKDRPLSQEEYERSIGVSRHDSATGLSWRSDIGAWEKIYPANEAGEHATSSTTTSINDDVSQSGHGLYDDGQNLVSPLECPSRPSLPSTHIPTTVHVPLQPSRALGVVSPRDALMSNPPDLPDVSLPATGKDRPLVKKRSRVSFSPCPTPSPSKQATGLCTYIDKVPSLLPSQSPSTSPSATTDRRPIGDADNAGLKSILYEAVYDGDLEKAQQLLRTDRMLDVVHEDQGILAAGAMWGHAMIKKIMAEHELDPHTGKCPVCHLSALDFKKDIGIVKALLKHGVDIRWSGGLCGSPLATAAWLGRPKIVRLLLDNGADVAQGGGKYKHVLCFAAAEAGFNGNLEVVKLLVQAGAKVSAFGPLGNAMSLAMKRRDFWLAQAEERPHLAAVESRIASCDLMVRYLQRAEDESRLKKESALISNVPAETRHASVRISR